MLVVCAPNAFKGSLTAAQAAAALASGVRRGGADAVTRAVADGGDGTLDVLVGAVDGRITEAVVQGPLGNPVTARIGWLSTTEAVIELADAAGLRLLSGSKLNPLAASTRGVGELIGLAIDAGAKRIIVGVGGSATTDGGLGILESLGAIFRDGDGNPIPDGGGATAWVGHADIGPALDRVRGVSIEVAADVDNPLTGPTGAAAVFAPQKGANERQVAHLEEGLVRFAAILEQAIEMPGLAGARGMGAAGGSAFGLAILGADIVPGAALVCDRTRLDDVLAGADLVITGEGRLDAQTARGKAPAEVAWRSAIRGIRCVAIAGAVEDPLPDLFSEALALGTAPDDIPGALRRLEELAEQLVSSSPAR